MFPPWHELKQTEMMLLNQRADSGMSPGLVVTLRRLFDRCKEMTDADEAICYHGTLALLYESDGNVDEAIKHRRIEIDKIESLHQHASKNVGDRAALKNYDVDDLKFRHQILDELVRNNAK